MPIHSDTSNKFYSENQRPKVLTSADYAAGGIYLTELDHVVYSTPANGGVLGIKLPPLNKCPYGSVYTVWHFESSNQNNTTIDDLNDGIATIGTTTLTADKNHASFMALGDYWLILVAVTS